MFAKNCMKMKEFGLRGGARSWRPLDPPLINLIFNILYKTTNIVSLLGLACDKYFVFILNLLSASLPPSGTPTNETHNATMLTRNYHTVSFSCSDFHALVAHSWGPFIAPQQENCKEKLYWNFNC